MLLLNNYYKIHSIIQYRSPLLNEKDTLNINEAINEKWFQEVILTINYNLYTELIRFNSLNKKEQNNLRITLTNYLKRMHTRSTPFGLLAAVNIYDNNKINEDKSINKKKKVRPSLEWLNSLYLIIIKRSDVFYKLQFSTNPQTYKAGYRYKLLLDSKNISIKENDFLNLIFNPPYSNKGFNFHEIYDKFKTQKGINKNCIKSIMLSLIKLGFIRTNIEPNLVNCNYFSKLIEILGENKLSLKLRFIQKLINEYEEECIGEGINTYLQIIKEMSSICTSKEYLNIDLFTNEEIEIPKQEVTELTTMLNYIASITPSINQFPLIDKYLNKFINKFGYDAEISVKELLNPIIGLGSPYQNSNEQRNTKDFQKKIYKFIFDNFNKNKIDIRDLNQDYQVSQNTYDSFNIIFQKLKKGWKVVPNVGSNCMIKANGRFVYGLNAQNLKLRKNSNEEYVELTELPNPLKVANVEEINSSCDYFTNTQHNNSIYSQNYIDLNDIYVKVIRSKLKDKFILFSKKLKKELKFTCSNMVNYPYYHSDIFRFLMDVSLYDQDNIFSIMNTFNYLELHHIPEINYGDIILVPERWNIWREDISSTNLQNLINKLDIPQLVYLEEEDHNLLIDFNNNNDIAFLKKQLLSHKKITLTKVYDTTNKEFVFSVEKKNTNNNKYIQNDVQTSYKSNVRVFMPGSDWIYITVFTEEDVALSIIRDVYSQLIQTLNKKQLIDKTYYLKYYHENQPCLRIRFHSKSEKTIMKLYKEIFSWINYLKQHNFSNNIQINTYKREIERYGGEENIEKYEMYFYTDSLWCIKTLCLINQNKSLKDFINVLSTAFYVINLCGSINQAKKLLKAFKNHSDKDYQYKYRKEIYPYFTTHTDLVESIYNNLSSLNGNEVKNPNILDSLIHMHCNRLFISHFDEGKFLYLVSRMVDTIYYLEKDKKVTNND